MPSRTWLPRRPTTVTRMLPLMTIVSFSLRLRTNMVADSFQPLSVGGEAGLPTRGALVRFDSIRIALTGRVPSLRAVVWRTDLDAIAYLAHALYTAGNLLSDLLEIMGGEAAP